MNVASAVLVASCAIAAPAAAVAPQVALDRTGVNTVRIFAYRISLEQADDREKLGLVAQELRTRAEAAERRWREAREAARTASAKHAAGVAQLVRLQQMAAQREAEFAQAVERLTEELAAKDVDYKRRLAVAIADGAKLLETEDGRRAIELIALGGDKNISEGLDTLDAAAAIADKMDGLRKAERYRQRARVNLGVRGIGTATTEKIIGLFETVVASDPESYRDWLELAGLYRDANRLEASIKASDSAYRSAGTDGERAIAMIERADTRFLQLNSEETLLSLRKVAAEMVLLKEQGPAKLATLPPDRKGAMMLAVLHDFVDAMPAFTGGAAPAVEAYRAADLLLQRKDANFTDAERMRWRAKCSLRIALAYHAKIKIEMASIFQRVMQRVLPPKGAAVTDADLSKIFSTSLTASTASVLAGGAEDVIKKDGELLKNQVADLIAKLEGLRLADASVSSRLELSDAFCQLFGMVALMGGSDYHTFETFMDPTVSALMAEYPDLISAKRAKGNYLFVAGVVAAQATDKNPAVERLRAASTIYADLIRRDPSSAMDRRAAAKTMARLAAIANSGVTRENAVAAYEKLRADGMLAPADEGEFALLELAAKMGSSLPAMFPGMQ